jgi:hypothetical protein
VDHQDGVIDSETQIIWIGMKDELISTKNGKECCWLVTRLLRVPRRHRDLLFSFSVFILLLIKHTFASNMKTNPNVTYTF